MIKYTYPAVLTIAGSDSGGGAGIQADLKTFSALGCFGTSAITAITVQNTVGVAGIHAVPVDIVAAQIKAVMDDIKPAAVKIGMVHSRELALAIADTLRDYPATPIVLDPVMVATSGDRLIKTDTVATLIEVLFPLATLVTPNLDEAAIITNTPVKTVEDMKVAASVILKSGCNAALVKGGHLSGAQLHDYYLDSKGEEHLYSVAAIDTVNTHGTGCSLSSAIAAFLAQGYNLADAIDLATDYIYEAIAQGADVITGAGHGPLNHFFNPKPLIKNELE